MIDEEGPTKGPILPEKEVSSDQVRWATALVEANRKENHTEELEYIMKLGELLAQEKDRQSVLHAAGLYHYALHLIQDQEEESLTPEPKYLKEMSHLDRQKKKEEIFGHLGQVEVQLLRLLGSREGIAIRVSMFSKGPRRDP